MYGARPLARIIQQELLVPLSRHLISESIRDGETARVEVDAARNRIQVIPNHQGTQSMDVDDDDLQVEELGGDIELD